MNAASSTCNRSAGSILAPVPTLALALAFALALAVSVFGAFALSEQAYAAAPKPANAYVGGVTYSKWPSGVSWTNADGVCTLPLNNAHIKAGDSVSKIGTKTGIYISSESGANGVTSVTIDLTNDSTITTASGDYAIYNACPDVTLRIVGAGTLTISGGCKEGVYSKGPLEIAAKVTIQDSSSHGVKAEAPVTINGGKLSITGKSSYGIYANSTFATKRGSVSISGAKTAIHSQGAMRVSANVSAANCQYGLDAAQTLTVSGGKITVTNPSLRGLSSYSADVNISGGTINVTNYGGHAIQAKRNVNITGGKISAMQSTANRSAVAVAVGTNYAINNSKAPNCWGTIRGRLDNGATFVKSGSTYKVQTPNNTYVTLVKYGGSSKKPTVDKVTFGEVSYNVKAVGSKAFYKNKKIKSVKFGSFVTAIGSKAFYGCKKLKTIDFRKIWYPASLKVGSKAFTKAYAKPKVKVQNSAAKTYVKKQLKKRGLKKAKYKILK